MITHNGKYLSVATHHGMPIVAATMGGKMVIGGKWLLSDTLQAIVAAFGSAEGTEVIRKTNDYLNRIATTDQQRALLLAGFINEDPMLVCSLVETSKVRGLHTSNGAKIFTNYIPLTTDLVRVTLKINGDTTSVPYGTRNTAGATDGGAFYVYTNNTKRLRIDWATSNTTDYVNIEIDKYFTIEHKKGYCVINGNVVFNKSVSAINAKYPLYLFTLNNAGVSNSSIPNITINEVYCEGKLHLVPFLRNGSSGMLDIISGTFYPNANTEGSFTIALTDKTTS